MLCLFHSIKIKKLKESNLQVHELLTALENNDEVLLSDFLLSGGAAIHVLIFQNMAYSLHMYKGKVSSYILKMRRVTLCMVSIVQYFKIFTKDTKSILSTFPLLQMKQQGNN